MTLAGPGCGEVTKVAENTFEPASPGRVVVATSLPSPGFWEGDDHGRHREDDGGVARDVAVAVNSRIRAPPRRRADPRAGRARPRVFTPLATPHASTTAAAVASRGPHLPRGGVDAGRPDGADPEVPVLHRHRRAASATSREGHCSPSTRGLPVGHDLAPVVERQPAQRQDGRRTAVARRQATGAGWWSRTRPGTDHCRGQRRLTALAMPPTYRARLVTDLTAEYN